MLKEMYIILQSQQRQTFFFAWTAVAYNYSVECIGPNVHPLQTEMGWNEMGSFVHPVKNGMESIDITLRLL